MSRILLFTSLWTCLARMRFREVSLEENLHGPRCLVLDLTEVLRVRMASFCAAVFLKEPQALRVQSEKWRSERVGRNLPRSYLRHRRKQVEFGQ